MVILYCIRKWISTLWDKDRGYKSKRSTIRVIALVVIGLYGRVSCGFLHLLKKSRNYKGINYGNAIAGEVVKFSPVALCALLGSCTQSPVISRLSPAVKLFSYNFYYQFPKEKTAK